jgi:hypothetical protein
MEKLKLELDELAVESFRTAEAEPARGTVNAHATQLKTCAATCHCTSVDIGCFCTEQC